MSFTAADIPVQVPNPLGDLVKRIGEIDPSSREMSRAQIDALTLKVDESVTLSHALLDRTLEYELKWRTSVFRGETSYDVAIEDGIRSSLKMWADNTATHLSLMDRLEPFGISPSGLESLKTRLAEVRQMLTPDDEFFEGEELDALTAQTLGEDEQGQTVEFRVMGE